MLSSVLGMGQNGLGRMGPFNPCLELCVKGNYMKTYWFFGLLFILSACRLMEPDARPLLPATAVPTPTISAAAAATAFTAQQQLQTPQMVTVPANFATAVADQPSWPDTSILPTEFKYQPTATWERYAVDSQTFIAWRTQAAEFASETAVDTLIQDAGLNVPGFISSDPIPTLIGERDWLWIDFTYALRATAVSEEPIQGFIAIQNDGQIETVVWAEAPIENYPQLLQDVFLRVLGAG